MSRSGKRSLNRVRFFISSLSEDLARVYNGLKAMGFDVLSGFFERSGKGYVLEVEVCKVGEEVSTERGGSEEAGFVIFPVEMLKEMCSRVMSLWGSAGKVFLWQYGVLGGLWVARAVGGRGKTLFREAFRALEGMGYGRFEFFEEEGAIVIRAKNLPDYGDEENGESHLVRGFLSGIASAALNEEVVVIEEGCKSCDGWHRFRVVKRKGSGMAGVEASDAPGKSNGKKGRLRLGRNEGLPEVID